MTNVQFSDTTHVFYNPETNVLVTIQHKSDISMFEVRRSDVHYVRYTSMNRIIEDRGDDVWEFLGIL